jgi:predicted metal-dependent hydrolase
MTDIRDGGAQSRVGSAEVPMRPMEFDTWLADLPKYFATDGDIMMSHILMVLSSTFPDGEDFFVRSVEAFRDQITDPRLRAEVDGFIGQEEMHGREHRVLNDHLAEFGYPTGAISKYVRGLLWVRERIQTKKPFASPRAVRQLLQYHRRGFHPNDCDTKQLVAEWRETLFGNDGELVEALAS